MKKIILGVSSSISIYKACELVRRLQDQNLCVQVVMTPNAARLVSPQLFSSLSGQDTLVELFNQKAEAAIAHIDLAKSADLLLVAPATANIIAKFASGVADDFLSTLYLAADCPVVVAPAMNEKMYRHARTQGNIDKLRADGVFVIESGQGYLACGDTGWGRLAAVEDIVKLSLLSLKTATALAGRKVLITAGPTREYMDPVRFLTSPSSGKMGFELAAEAERRGAEVVLISGPTQLPAPLGVDLIRVGTAREMETAVLEASRSAEIIIMAAAVADFTFAAAADQKIKKAAYSSEVKMVRTTDILEKLGRNKGTKILVGFAAESEKLEQNARDKLVQKNLDMIVANDISQPGMGFDSAFNQVTIFTPQEKPLQTEKLSKREISRIVWEKVEGLIGESTK